MAACVSGCGVCAAWRGRSWPSCFVPSENKSLTDIRSRQFRQRQVHSLFNISHNADIKLIILNFISATDERTSWSSCFLPSEFRFSLQVGKGKGKAVPLQAWSGPEDSRKLRFPDFITAQDGGKIVSLTHRPSLPPGNTPGTHFC